MHLFAFNLKIVHLTELFHTIAARGARDKYQVWLDGAGQSDQRPTPTPAQHPSPLYPGLPSVPASETKEKAQGVDQDTELQLSSGGGLVGL